MMTMMNMRTTIAHIVHASLRAKNTYRNFDVHLGIQQQVLWLQVPVHHLCALCVLHFLCNAITLLAYLLCCTALFMCVYSVCVCTTPNAYFTIVRLPHIIGCSE